MARREFASLYDDPYAFWRRLREWILSVLKLVTSALSGLPGWVSWMIVAWMLLALAAILAHLIYTLWKLLGGTSWASRAGASARPPWGAFGDSGPGFRFGLRRGPAPDDRRGLAGRDPVSLRRRDPLAGPSGLDRVPHVENQLGLRRRIAGSGSDSGSVPPAHGLVSSPSFTAGSPRRRPRVTRWPIRFKVCFMGPLQLSRADRLLLGIVLVTAVLVALVTWLVLPPEKTGGMEKQPSTFFNVAYGTKAAYLVLERLEYPVTRLRRPIERETLGGIGVLFVLEPEIGLRDREVAVLESWVKEGHALVVVPGSSITLPHLGSFLGQWFHFAEGESSDEEMIHASVRKRPARFRPGAGCRRAAPCGDSAVDGRKRPALQPRRAPQRASGRAARERLLERQAGDRRPAGEVRRGDGHRPGRRVSSEQRRDQRGRQRIAAGQCGSGAVGALSGTRRLRRIPSRLSAAGLVPGGHGQADRNRPMAMGRGAGTRRRALGPVCRGSALRQPAGRGPRSRAGSTGSLPKPPAGCSTRRGLRRWPPRRSIATTATGSAGWSISNRRRTTPAESSRPGPLGSGDRRHLAAGAERRVGPGQPAGAPHSHPETSPCCGGTRPWTLKR